MSDFYDNMETLSKDDLIMRLKEAEEEKKTFQYLLDNLHGMSWEYDLHRDLFTYISSDLKKIFGYEKDDWRDLNSLIEKVHEEDKQKVETSFIQRDDKSSEKIVEYRMFNSDRTVIWVCDVIRTVVDDDKKINRLQGFMLDITQRKNEELKLAQEHQFLQTVINSISDPVMIINSDYSVDIMNSTVQDSLKGRTFLDPSSPKCYEISHFRDSPCDGENDPCPLKQVLETGEKTKVMHNHKHADGSDHYVELAASPLFDSANNCVGIIESARDITSYIQLANDLKETTKMLKYEATHDYLTGLPNRGLFMDRLEQSMLDAKRRRNSLALFFMDLDHFKQINDTLGHHMGDSVLKKVCQLLRYSTRSNDVLSRLAGDEFTLILKDVKDNDHIASIAQKFIDLFEKPILVEDQYIKLSLSIGISVYDYEIESSEKLLQMADTAMYEAKAAGKSNFVFAN